MGGGQILHWFHISANPTPRVYDFQLAQVPTSNLLKIGPLNIFCSSLRLSQV